MKKIFAILLLSVIISCNKESPVTTTKITPVQSDTATYFFKINSWSNDSNLVYPQFFVATDSFPNVNLYSDSIIVYVKNNGWQKVPQLFSGDSIMYQGSNKNGIPYVEIWYLSKVFNKNKYPTGIIYFKIFVKPNL